MAAKENHVSSSNVMTSPLAFPRRSLPALFLVAAIILAFLGCYYLSLQTKTPSSGHPANLEKPRHSQRIIALAPSIVEIIYQLNLSDQLVGVSRFCNHPPEAKNKPVVGGYLNLDFEAVLNLQPDCIILLKEQKPVATKLASMGIRTITVDHSSTDSITRSISTLGKAFLKETEAQTVVNNIHRRTQQITRNLTNTIDKPRVLVCIDRDTSAKHPQRVFIAGNKGVHQEYIRMAGAVNAYQGPMAYPMLSREKLIHLNPDIIIELVQEKVWNEKGQLGLMQQWQTFNELSAVKNNQIVFLHEPSHMIPGPRWVDTLETFHHIIQQTR